MIRAVLDTNVIVSSFLGPGSIPDQIIMAWRLGRFELCISRPLLDEAWDVMLRPLIQRRIKASPEDVDQFLGDLPEKAGMFIESLVIEPIIKDDPDDDVVLATAVAVQADLIVSGDAHLLALGSHRGIRIVTPKEFLRILRELGEREGGSAPEGYE